MSHLRRYFFAGLFFWVPIWVTLLVVHFVLNLLSNTFSLIPEMYRPQNWLGFDIPGIGILLSLIIVFCSGILVTNFLGRKIVQLGEAIVGRIPLVRTIYMGSKQIIDTMVSSSNQSFRKVALIEYPRKGSWAIGFLTGYAPIEIQQQIGHESIYVFIPTTPNPTSGFLLLVPKHEIHELDMTIEQAFKLIISMGVIQHPEPLQNGVKL